MRATFLAGGEGIAKATVTARSIDLAPTLAYLLGVPGAAVQPGPGPARGGQGRQQRQADLDRRPDRLPRPARFLDAGLRRDQPGRRRRRLPGHHVRRGAGVPAGSRDSLLAAGDNVGASPPNSLLLEDMPTIDVENAWGLDATSYGNHEFDYGVARLLKQQARAKFPFLATNIFETHVEPSAILGDAVKGLHDQRDEGRRHRCGAPEHAGARLRRGHRRFALPAEAPRIKAESERLRKLGVQVQVVVIHQGTNVGKNPLGNAAGAAWSGPILDIADALQGTTVDAMIVGHTHRISNLMRGHILITEGINAGVSYSVLQLMVKGGDVQWAGGATRVAKTIGVAARPDVKAIVDDGERQDGGTAQPGDRHASRMTSPVRPPGSSSRRWATSWPIRCGRSTPASTLPTPTPVVFAPTSCSVRPRAGEKAGEITWGEVFAVLPFGNRSTILTLSGSADQRGVHQWLHPEVRRRLRRRNRPLPADLRPEGRSSTATGSCR